MFDFSNILSRIKALKKAQGFTNATLAQASGVPKSTVDKILAGLIKDPSIVTIIKISHALGETVDFILDCDLDIEQNSFSKSDEVYTTNEKKLLSNYKQLSHIGQMKVLDFCDDLISSGKYSAVGREPGYKMVALGGTATQGDDQPPIEEIIIT